MAPRRKPVSAEAKKTFQSLEEAILRLEEIVANLEEGETGLEQSIDLYREGRLLGKHCMERLGELEKQVLLVQKETDGAVRTEPFGEDEP